MKIAAITPYEKLDYLAETIIEGIYKNGIELKCSCPGNGVRSEDVLPIGEFYEYAKDADYIFAIWGKKRGTYPGIDYDVVKRVNRPESTVYIDGSEWTFSGQPEVGQVAEAKYDSSRRRGTQWVNTDMLEYCKWYFKRECYPEDAKLGIIPLLFGAVERYYNDVPQEKTIDLFCAYGQINDGLRRETEQLCNQLKDEGFKVVTGGGYDFNTYKNILSQSYIAVDAWGGGDCCARLWEIFANKTCAFTQKYNILFPNKFIDGTSYVEYSTIQEFETKIRYYLNNKSECHDIGLKGYEHLTNYHTSEQRVKYILENIQ
tara:strand:- start:1957 stop:2904 length:948 start_codon:yes stop_codon:yes gene_type:complete